jgi:hypothetical protein
VDIPWGQRTEVTISHSICARFDRSLSGSSLQFWDSDTHKTCDYRGTATSVDGTGSVNINGNYVTGAVTGTKLKFTAAAGSSCNYLKLRAY